PLYGPIRASSRLADVIIEEIVAAGAGVTGKRRHPVECTKRPMLPLPFAPSKRIPMQKIISLTLVIFVIALGSASRSAQDKEITFDEVHKNPAAFKGKKVTWEGKFSGLLNNRVTFIGNYDRKGAGKTEPWQLFVVDFPDGKDALAAVGGGKVTGTVE